jgi:hypothetical protein
MKTYSMVGLKKSCIKVVQQSFLICSPRINQEIIRNSTRKLNLKFFCSEKFKNIPREKRNGERERERETEKQPSDSSECY